MFKNFIQNSRKFLETSRKFVEISRKLLEISKNVVEISRKFLEMSRRILENSMKYFVEISTSKLMEAPTKVETLFRRACSKMLIFPWFLNALESLQRSGRLAIKNFLLCSYSFFGTASCPEKRIPQKKV